LLLIKNMLDFSFDPFPVITTERLILRRVTESDVNEILFLRSDKKVLEYISMPHTKSSEEARAFIKKIDGLIQSNEGINWAISLKGETKLIGTICIWNIIKEHHRAEVGYVLHPEHQGKGIMQEALTEVLRYGFKEMNIHSFAANVNPKNLASIKLLERNDFTKEAFFKENYFFDNKFFDTVVYGLPAPEKTKLFRQFF